MLVLCRMQEDPRKIKHVLRERSVPCWTKNGHRFAVIARTEALIKGLGLEVALDRARSMQQKEQEGSPDPSQGNRSRRPFFEFARDLVSMRKSFPWFRSDHVRHDELRDTRQRRLQVDHLRPITGSGPLSKLSMKRRRAA